MTFKELDDPTGTEIPIYYDPTGDAGMKDQSALNDREVQPRWMHAASGDKRTRRINIRTELPEDDKPT